MLHAIRALYNRFACIPACLEVRSLFPERAALFPRPGGPSASSRQGPCLPALSTRTEGPVGGFALGFRAPYTVTLFSDLFASFEVWAPSSGQPVSHRQFVSLKAEHVDDGVFWAK